MSKVVLGVLFAAIILIALAIQFQVLFVASSSGLVMVVALIYSYTVTKRDNEGASGGFDDRMGNAA